MSSFDYDFFVVIFTIYLNKFIFRIIVLEFNVVFYLKLVTFDTVTY